MEAGLLASARCSPFEAVHPVTTSAASTQLTTELPRRPERPIHLPQWRSV